MKPNVMAAWVAHFISEAFYYIGVGAHHVRQAAYSASEWAMCWAIHLQGKDKRGPYRTWSDDE